MQQDNQSELTDLERQYILEEVSLLMGCVPLGLGFSNHSSPNTTQQPLYIVYPGDEKTPFREGKKLLQQSNSASSLFDVNWMEISLQEKKSSKIMLDNSEENDYSAYMSDKLNQQLLNSKDKYLLFLISIGKPYHTGNRLTATINLFANIIRYFAKLHQQKEALKQTNKLNNFDRKIENATGNWHILVVAADTLQAYNQADYQKALEKYTEMGREWMQEAGPLFKSLEQAGEDKIKVKVDLINWAPFLKMGQEYFNYEEKYQRLLKLYIQPEQSVVARTFYQAVRDTGIGFRLRQNKTQEQPNKQAIENSRDLTYRLTGESNSTLTNNSEFLFKQFWIFKSHLFNLNPQYAEFAFDVAQFNLDQSINFKLPVLNKELCVQRSELLQKLNACFIFSQTTTPTTHPMIVIQGMGGIGKTHLALYYAYQTEHLYNLRIWVSAESKHSLQASFLQLSQILLQTDESKNLSLTEKYKRTKHWLEVNPGWLLIIDDVKEFESIKEYLPECGGHILITSRLANWNQKNVRLLAIDVMASDEAVSLLQKTSGRDNVQENSKELAYNLGYLPLALEWAGAYLKQHPHTTINEYLIDYQKNLLSLIESKEHASNPFSRTVAATFRSSIIAIELEYANALKKALLNREELHKKSPTLFRDLLAVCSYFGSENIHPYFVAFWLHQGYLKSIEQVPYMEEFWNFFIEILVRYSLAKYNPDTGLTLHPIFQDILRAQNIAYLKTSDAHSQWLEQIIASIYRLLETMCSSQKITNSLQNNKATPPTIHHLMPHLETLFTHCNNYNLKNSLILARTKFMAANIFLIFDEDYKNTIKLLKEALENCTALCNSSNRGYCDQEDCLVIEILAALSTNYNRLGLANDSKLILKRINSILELHSKLSVHILELIKVLRASILASKDLDLAEYEINKRHAEKTTQTIEAPTNNPNDDSIFLIPKLILSADECLKEKDWIKWQALLNQAVDLAEKCYGNDNLEFFQILHGIGSRCIINNRLINAQAFLERALIMIKETSSNHWMEAKILEAISAIHFRNKNYEAAKFHAIAALKLIAIHHPHKKAYHINLLTNLCSIYFKTKQLDKVKFRLDLALKISKLHNLDSDPESLLHIKSCLAEYYMINNDYDKAYKYALEARLWLEKAGHPLFVNPQKHNDDIIIKCLLEKFRTFFNSKLQNIYKIFSINENFNKAKTLLNYIKTDSGTSRPFTINRTKQNYLTSGNFLMMGSATILKGLSRYSCTFFSPSTENCALFSDSISIWAIPTFQAISRQYSIKEISTSALFGFISINLTSALENFLTDGPTEPNNIPALSTMLTLLFCLFLAMYFHSKEEMAKNLESSRKPHL